MGVKWGLASVLPNKHLFKITSGSNKKRNNWCFGGLWRPRGGIFNWIVIPDSGNNGKGWFHWLSQLIPFKGLTSCCFSVNCSFKRAIRLINFIVFWTLKCFFCLSFLSGFAFNVDHGLWRLLGVKGHDLYECEGFHVCPDWILATADGDNNGQGCTKKGCKLQHNLLTEPSNIEAVKDYGFDRLSEKAAKMVLTVVVARMRNKVMLKLCQE